MLGVQCTANSKQTGERCKRYASPGFTVCYYHGGRTPRGEFLPQTTHGRYSGYMPVRMRARYQEAERDPNLLTLQSEIHLLDARLADVLGRVDTGESGRLWIELQAAAADLATARRTGDQTAQVDALNTILTAIRQGRADWAAWQDVRGLIDQRARLVAAEQKHQQSMTVNQFMLLAGALVAVFRDAVQRNVTDEKQRRKTLADASAGVERLISRPDSEGPDRG